MAFDHIRGSQQGRPSRSLALAFVIASVLLASTTAALAWAAGQQEPAPAIDDDVVVQFTPREQEPAPEPPAVEPPPAAPMVVPDSAKVNPAAPRPQPLVAPDDDRSKLREADPSQDKGVAGVRSDQAASAEPGGIGTGPGTLPSSRPPPQPEEKKEPAKGVATISEGTTPPVPVTTPTPAYPSELRAEGAETRVVCKIKIAASGAVAGGKCFQGDARFHPASIAALKAWRFKPAIGPDGQPVEFVKTVVFPFAIRN